MQRNLQKLQNHADQSEILTILAEWGKKSDNAELQLLQMAMDRIISEAMADKHRALARAQRAEERITPPEDPVNRQINDRIKLKESLAKSVKKISKLKY